MHTVNRYELRVDNMFCVNRSFMYKNLEYDSIMGAVKLSLQVSKKSIIFFLPRFSAVRCVMILDESERGRTYI